MATKIKNITIKKNKLFAKIENIKMESFFFESYLEESEFNELDFFIDKNGGTKFFGDHLKLINLENIWMFSHIDVWTGIGDDSLYTFDLLVKMGNINGQQIYSYNGQYYQVVNYNPVDYIIELEKVMIIIEKW